MIIIYIIKQIVSCLLHRQKISNANFYKGCSLYIKSKNQSSDVKSFLKVLGEVNHLATVWKAWPDCYFRMNMYMQEWSDMDQMKSFVPQDAYARYANDVDSRYHLLIDDKILFHDILSYYGISVPIRYFIFRNNEFRKGSHMLSDSEVNEILEKDIEDNRIFVKRYTGGASKGVSILTKNEQGHYVDKDGIRVSASMIRDKFSNQDYIFEKQIVQDFTLKQFNPDTVNTIRVLTYKHKVIAATVRFGGKGEFVDNISANGVAVSLDINSGMLGDYGLRMYNSQKFYEHPDSHIKFKGVKVEQWPQVISIVENTLHFLPYYNSVGFDVATTVDGPVIVEINTGAGINLSQMGKRTGLRDKFLSSMV